MTTQDLIKQILARNPQISQFQIMERLQAERARTGGLLCDETLLRLIAAKFGVEVEQNTIHNSGVMLTSRLLAGFNDVTVAGRLIAVFPVRSFEGEKPGKFATLMVADNEGILRVVLWNDKAELVEKGDLKAGQAIRFLHGYTRCDRYGKVELHLGGKSQLVIEPPETSVDYPNIGKFVTKIGSLKSNLGNVHLSGKVRDVREPKTFTRNDASEGKVLRLVLADDSGEVTVVAWDEKATELEKLKMNEALQLVNVRVKEAQQGGLEVHVDSSTYVVINE